MKQLLMIVLLSMLAGCASTPVYDPLQADRNQQLLLNESALKAVQDGMTIDDVHKIMGQTIIIGYTYQSSDSNPLTISNPYKSEVSGAYTIEYYIASIRQSDGVVSDDELMPLVFKDGRLVGRGWSFVHSLSSPKST